MAQFNPQVNPTNDPNYLSYSKPISQPEGSKVFETLFKGIGNVLETGVKAVDTVIKTGLDDKIYKYANAEREGFTAALEDDYNKRVTDTEVLPTRSGTAVPQDLEKVPQTLETLKTGLDERKYTKTYYVQRLHAFAKELRSQYPGYRDYIDNQFQKVTGIDPANAYVTSLITDLNSRSDKKKTEYDMVLKELGDNIKLPGAFEVREGVRLGHQQPSEGWAFLNRTLSKKYILDAERDQIKLDEDRRGVSKIEHEEHFTKRINAIGSGLIEGLTLGSGLNEVKVVDLLEKAARGETKIPTEQLDQIAELLAGYKIKATREALRQASDTSRGKSTLEILQAPRVNELINSNLDYFDKTIDLIKNDKTGLALHNIRRIKAITDNTQVGLLDGDMGSYLRVQSGLRALGGDQYSLQMFNTFLRSKMAPKWEQVSTELLAKAALQIPDIRRAGMPDANPTGEAVTVNQLIDEARRKGMDKGSLAEFSKAATGLITKIGDKDTPDAVKINYAKAAFDPKNRDLLAKFAMDYVDSNNRNIPGRNTLFSTWTSQNVTQEMARLGKKDPQLWNNYVQWAENEFGNHLFSRQIQDLQRYREFTGVAVSWDSDKKQFKVNIYNPDVGPYGHLRGNMPKPPGAEQAERTVRQLNIGLNSMRYIAEAGGTDVETYLLQRFQQFGGNLSGVINPKQTDVVSNITGGPANITNELLRAIVVSRAKEKLKKGEGTIITDTGTP